MPRSKNPPGTERFRDEKRTTATPRMHGGPWHDPHVPHEAEPEAMTAGDAVIGAESGGGIEGFGHGKLARDGKRGKARADVASPRGKGTPGEQQRQASPTARGTKKPG